MPPPEVLAALDRAQDVLGRISRAGMQVRLEVSEGDRGAQVVVKLMAADGTVIKQLSPSALAQLMSGRDTGGQAKKTPDTAP